MPARFSPEAIRAAIIETTRDIAQFGNQAIEARYLYVPKAHAQALLPGSMLVEGIRGAGKSVWWAALQSPGHRRLIVRALGTGFVQPDAEVLPGFGDASRPDEY